MNNTTFTSSNNGEAKMSIPIAPGIVLIFITVLVTTTLLLWRKYWNKLQPTHVFELSVLTGLMLGGLYPTGISILQANSFEEPYLVRYGGRFITLSLGYLQEKIDKYFDILVFHL